jgi:CubicO group peptidase (beta-lactamase class C family)
MGHMKKSSDSSDVRSFAVRTLSLVLFLGSVASHSALAASGPSGRSKAITRASQPDFSKARKLIQEQLAASYPPLAPVPSLSIAVARKGEVLWEERFGWADRENRIPATKDTMYYTASVAKIFTATALMVLHERKQLDLDRPVNDYLVGAKLHSPAWNPAQATVRRVETHTAGLTSFNAPQHMSVDEMIGRYGILFWPPGEHFDYSNLGPIINEEVIARVSGQSYAEFMRSKVFGPLGLTHASVGFDPSLAQYTARSYHADPKLGIVPPQHGGIYCSAHDLLRFGMFHLKTRAPGQKAILSARSIDAMQNETVDAGDNGRYGLGWWVEDNRFGYRSVLSQGGTDAAQAWLRLIPSEGIAVVLLCNAGNASANPIIDEILSALLPAYAENRKKPVAAMGSPQHASRPLPPFVGSWKGIIKTLRSDIPLTLSISESGDVHVQIGSQPAAVLEKTRFNEKRLYGIIAGSLGVEQDGVSQADKVEFELYLRDGALKGAAVTRPNPELPFWTELNKLPGTGAGQR